ncbi:MAG TPA: beta-ketoacyl-[acyl-carrier-protein] synthase family protein [Thermoanaerobaculia bacterium]
MTPRRVAVTGMGVVSALGCNVDEYRRALLECRAGIGVRESFDDTWPDDLPVESLRHPAGMAREPESAREDVGGVPLKMLDRFSRFAIAAAGEALADAGSPDGDPRRLRAAVIMGTAVGGDESRDHASYRILRRKTRPHPVTILRTMVNAAASAVSIAHGIGGPVLNISTACASSAHAIGQAYRMIQWGMTDLAVAGGAETLPSYCVYRSWQQMRVLSPDGCRPFAADRNGIVFGEGAGAVVLEPLDAALARGAHVYAEVTGFGMSADAREWAVGDPDGMVRCMREALTDAAVDARDLAHVHAHATGTVLGDAAEAAALRLLLGEETVRIPVSSTKALHGHALGASGAMELIATALGLDEGWIPAMPRAARDASLSLHLVDGEPAPLAGESVLSNSFGFGGLNASLVLRRVPQA